MEKSTREKVLGLATKLFVEKGLAGVSVQEIADAAEIGGQEVTGLFGSVEKLYEIILKNQFSRYATGMDAIFAGEELPPKKIALFAEAICALHRDSPDFFPLFYRELLDPSPYFETIVVKNIQHVAYLSDNNIGKGIQKGHFKRGINPANATMLLVGMFHYFFLARRLAGSLLPEPANDEEYYLQAVEVFLNGLKKGH